MMKLRTLFLAGIPALALAAPAHAQTDAYVSEIQLIAGGYCPRSTVDSAGQTMAINQNQALFALIGTTYGGNGQTTFQLPDLRGRVMLSIGQSPGLSNYAWGQKAGTTTETMLASNMPAHIHIGNVVGVVGSPPNIDNPTNAALADFPDAQKAIYNNTVSPDIDMEAGTALINPAGGGQPFSNQSPYLALHYCTTVYGIFPSRN